MVWAFTSVADGLSVRGKIVSASNVASKNCSGVKKCKIGISAASGVAVVDFWSCGDSEQPVKKAPANEADTALPVIQAVYLRISRLFRELVMGLACWLPGG